MAFLCLVNTRHGFYFYLDHEGHTKLSDDVVAYLRSKLTADHREGTTNHEDHEE
jgi:hypothetical protein